MRLPKGTRKDWSCEQKRARENALQRLRLIRIKADPILLAKHKAYNKARYRKNAEAIKAKTRAWAIKNQEKCAANNRRWASKYNLDTRVLERQKRRAREFGTPIVLTPSEWKEIKSSSTSCYYCGRSFNVRVRPTMDHIIPLSAGGPHARENIVAACKSCNCIKSKGTPDDLYRRLKEHGQAQIDRFDRNRLAQNLECTIECDVIMGLG